MKNEIKKLEHSSYRCQYHIVFAPKYRRKVIYGELRADIGKIIRKLCNEKKVELIEAEACPDHIHMLVSIPLYISVSQFMGYIKSKNAMMILKSILTSLRNDDKINFIEVRMWSTKYQNLQIKQELQKEQYTII